MMSSFPLRASSILLAAALLAGAAPAWARNDESMQPVAVATAKSAARKAEDGIVFRFGKASAQGADIAAADVHVQGKGDVAEGGAHRHSQPTDETVCRRAFNDALAQLASAAKAAGAAAVVGVVSDYKGAEHTDAATYECHSGSVHSFVELKGQLARTVPDDPAYPASGFARIDDLQAPPLSDEGKARYAAFLATPKPRAFAIYEDGHWWMSSRRSDAPAAVLRHCATEGKRCWLYAVDGQVVWSADVGKRIGDVAGGATPQDENE
jgi:hypothetical protein